MNNENPIGQALYVKILENKELKPLDKLLVLKNIKVDGFELSVLGPVINFIMSCLYALYLTKKDRRF